MGLFGKTPTLAEQLQGWKKQTRNERRALERQIQKLEGEVTKTMRMIKQVAKEKRMGALRSLALEVVRMRSAIDRMHAGRAQLNSMEMQLQEHSSMLKVAGVVSSSAGIMASVNNMIKMQDIRATAVQMGREMMKAGIIQDMLDDAIDSADPAEMDDAVQSKVDQILYEVTDGQMGQLSSVPTTAPVKSTGTAQASSSEATAAEPEDDTDDLQRRLAALQQ